MTKKIKMANVKALSAAQLEFINNKVSMSYLKNYGTATGFSEFCKSAVKAGVLKNCNGKSPASKEAYATYLVNANDGKQVSLWNKMVDDYGNLDSWTKAGMAKQVEKGKGLSAKTKKYLTDSSVYASCAFNNWTVSELKEKIKDLADVKDSDLKGLPKAELCAILDGIMVEQGSQEAAKSYWTLGTKDGPQSMKWSDYPFKPKEMESGTQLEKKYKKKYGLEPGKDKTQIYKDLLEGKLPEDLYGKPVDINKIKIQ